VTTGLVPDLLPGHSSAQASRKHFSESCQSWEMPGGTAFPCLPWLDNTARDTKKVGQAPILPHSPEGFGFPGLACLQDLDEVQG
jgi:hypothetical protein